MNSNIKWALTASDKDVGPACSKITVPHTIVMDESFREVYIQGYCHAIHDVRKFLYGELNERR